MRIGGEHPGKIAPQSTDVHDEATDLLVDDQASISDLETSHQQLYSMLHTGTFLEPSLDKNLQRES